MKIKALLLSGILALSMFCACGSNPESDATSNTESVSTESANSSGNFSEPIYIENPGTETVIVEMP